MMNLADAFTQWEQEIQPMVIEQYGKYDRPALSESWNDYTDALTKDGELTSLQYHFAPAYDEPFPDRDVDYILECLGTTATVTQIHSRPDGLMSDMGHGSTHYAVTIHRAEDSMTLFYSQGPAHTTAPELADIMYCVTQDAANVPDSFEEWADEYGYDTDSRKAEKTYCAVKRQSLDLQRLFTTDEIEQLGELFNNF